MNVQLTSSSTYQAAQNVADRVSSLFSDYLTLARANGDTELADAPPSHFVEAIIDASFWASLRKEEGHSTRISLAYLSPQQAGSPILFAKRLPLTSTMLTKIAPGFERPGVHLGVWHEDGELFVWGATHNIPNSCFVLDVSEPGLLVVKHRRFDGYGKFANIAVLTGDEIKIVDDRDDNSRECPFLLQSLLDFTSPSLWNNVVNVLLQLSVSMRAHQRGGTLLVVPTGEENWKKSIRTPFHYAIQPAFSGLSELMRKELDEKRRSRWVQALNKEIEIIAGLTAIDGAIVMNDQYELLAFGEKIIRAEGNGLVEQIFVTEPILGKEPEIAHPALSGGTRHLSAAQFVHDQQDSIALVASQDGRFTVFAWSPKKQMVQAHRIDTLLY
jgi:hypothetical protein